MQAVVFEMFVQVDASLERGPVGLGVGLALSRKLVELHGGSLRLQSAGLGRGATFSVRLARVPAGPADGAVGSVAATPAARGLRILLADDNADFADSLAHVLQSAGHDVHVDRAHAKAEYAITHAGPIGAGASGAPATILWTGPQGRGERRWQVTISARNGPRSLPISGRAFRPCSRPGARSSRPTRN